MATFAKNSILPDRRAPHERLTEMQYHIACALAAGKSIRAAGRAFDIHHSTARIHAMRIYQKCGFKDAKELKKYAAVNGVFGLKKPVIIVK